MRPAIALLLVLGVLLGPVYYAYCLYLSGRTTQTIRMTERASRWVTADGTILRFANGQAYKPIPLALTPDMNRVSFRLNFTFPGAADFTEPLELRYQATLAQFDHNVLERPISLRVSKAGSETVAIGPMDIPYPAEYLFVLEEVGNPDVVPELSLQLVEDIETPVRPVIWAGMALMILAFIIALRDVMRAARGHHRPG